MMAPTIRIDDEVFALLQAEAKPFVDTPNTVLRRKFGLDPRQAGTTANSPSEPVVAGRLWKLVEAGVLAAGDELLWKRRQQGTEHVAWVRSDGGLILNDGYEFDSPSGAARHFAGYEVNGWRTWRHTQTGKTLDELWTEHEGALS
jgi:hypothetical protein